MTAGRPEPTSPSAVGRFTSPRLVRERATSATIIAGSLADPRDAPSVARDLGLRLASTGTPGFATRSSVARRSLRNDERVSPRYGPPMQAADHPNAKVAHVRHVEPDVRPIGDRFPRASLRHSRFTDADGALHRLAQRCRGWTTRLITDASPAKHSLTAPGFSNAINRNCSSLSPQPPARREFSRRCANFRRISRTSRIEIWYELSMTHARDANEAARHASHRIRFRLARRATSVRRPSARREDGVPCDAVSFDHLSAKHLDFSARGSRTLTTDKPCVSHCLPFFPAVDLGRG